MATDRTIIKGVPADMSEAAFVAELARVKSPATSAGAAVYRYAVKRGLLPSALLGIFWEESRYGTDPAAICVGARGMTLATHSWGNTTSPSYGDPGGAQPLVRGRFTVYADWMAGGISTVARLFEHPAYLGKTTIRDIISTWAPPHDNNRTEEYIAGVAATITRLGGAMQRIAISAGHHNTDGGNRFEYQTTGELAEAIAAAARYQGIDVYVPQPDGPDADTERGDGDYPGGLQGVARAVVAEHAKSPFSVFLECHTQGGPGVPGMFGIYPDMAGDLDTDARDNLIPKIVDKVTRYTGLAKYGNGLLPESRTGVGLQGSRLGVFYASASIRADCTRLLIEYGAHDVPREAAIHRTPQFYVGAARGTVEAICEFLGLPVKAWGGNVVKEPIKETVKEEPPKPVGYLSPGQPDVFAWPTAAGVITYRKTRWFNPDENAWYELEWDHEKGYLPPVKVA